MPELTDDMEEPVACSACGTIVELNNCAFPDPNDSTYGLCDKCFNPEDDGE